MVAATELTPAEQQRLQALIAKIQPFLPDLLRQGSIQSKFDRATRPTLVLTFRQNRTGLRDGRQKRIRVGKSKAVAVELMEYIWTQREQAHTRQRPRPTPPRDDQQSMREYIAQQTRRDPSWADTALGQNLRRILELDQQLGLPGQQPQGA